MSLYRSMKVGEPAPAGLPDGTLYVSTVCQVQAYVGSATTGQSFGPVTANYSSAVENGVIKSATGGGRNDYENSPGVQVSGTFTSLSITFTPKSRSAIGWKVYFIDEGDGLKMVDYDTYHSFNERLYNSPS